MCSASFSMVLMATLLGMAPSAPAYKVTTASMILPSVASHNKLSSHQRLGVDTASQSSTVLIPGQNPTSSQIIPSAYREVKRITSSLPLSPNASPIIQNNSGWRYTAGFLGTLAIIATIGVRRRMTGKPWA